MKDAREIRVVVMEPGKAPEERRIGTGLSDWQSVVGGFLEEHPSLVWRELGVTCLINEEGRLLGAPANAFLPAAVTPIGVVGAKVLGTVLFVAGDGEGGSQDMTDDQVSKLVEILRALPRARPEPGGRG